jgi:hypothetical protein
MRREMSGLSITVDGRIAVGFRQYTQLLSGLLNHWFKHVEWAFTTHPQTNVCVITVVSDMRHIAHSSLFGATVAAFMLRVVINCTEHVKSILFFSTM